MAATLQAKPSGRASIYVALFGSVFCAVIVRWLGPDEYTTIGDFIDHWRHPQRSEIVKKKFVDLLDPETWLGESSVKMLTKLSVAVEAAKVHFEDVELVPVYRLIPLFKENLNYLSKHRKDKKWVELEWQEQHSDPLDDPTHQIMKQMVKFSALAYEVSDVVRENLLDLGYELLQWEPQVGFERPSYFIAFDADKKSVVVAVRGTSSFDDMLTDILHTPEPFINGTYAHSGIASAAKFIVNRTIPLWEKLFQPLGYKLFFTGHSLGAGTATLASVIFKWEKNIENHCYVFAPPPTLNKAAATLTKDLVTAVVHNDDIIPRFNFGLLAAGLVLFSDIDRKLQKNGISAQEYFERKTDFQRTKKQVTALVEKVAKGTGETKDMHISGDIILYVAVGEEGEEGYSARRVSNDFPALRRIDASDRLLSDHGVQNYEQILELEPSQLVV
mmetsp:Transcript_14379/g.25368  ORF Transcript_14379/g.25368 Transcript_14379/m.25368 type:complete len:444 (-) Transcript_14379:70-1401(-)|eukprot:CAMPEP_0203764438 /NCGR_PEP_ID=MMETSP0098-20131031/17682_1 /ASSEMBLY_ACC=CAM_ASM_000208 /TAXON_ID=96639 /ORGANISM=" , Strain NY0313808BC1" /LENGTH=443 /DNA_ID=CAMNT_0050660281 /DNA_START=372 /DNA_END=1703 /DNA_ORIENTATION=+